MAAEVLMSVSKDENEWAILHSRKMAQKDYESYLLTAKRIGRTEGRKEGRKEERFSIAKNLMSMNFPIEQIAVATGLTREEVEQSRVIN